jgi:hypothetical protein
MSKQYDWMLEYSKILQSVNDFLKEVLPFEEWDEIGTNAQFFEKMVEFVKNKKLIP